MSEEVTYQVLRDGHVIGTITRTEFHRAKDYERVVFPMYEAVIRANVIASELLSEWQVDCYHGEHDT